MMETANWEVAPILRVRDVRTAAAYYRDRLGFDCPYPDVVPEAGLKSDIPSEFSASAISSLPSGFVFTVDPAP